MNRLEDMDITYLTGVGPKRAELLKKELGIATFYDLLYFSHPDTLTAAASIV